MEKFLAESVLVLAAAVLVIFTIAFFVAVFKKLKGELVFPCKKKDFPAFCYSFFSFAMSLGIGAAFILLTENAIAGVVGFIFSTVLSIWLLRNIKFQPDK